MKKIFTQACLAICFITLISCHKEVKKPVGKVPDNNAKSSTTTTTTYTGTQTTTQNQSGHTCGSGSSGNGPD